MYIYIYTCAWSRTNIKCMESNKHQVYVDTHIYILHAHGASSVSSLSVLAVAQASKVGPNPRYRQCILRSPCPCRIPRNSDCMKMCLQLNASNRAHGKHGLRPQALGTPALASM